jgi:2-polyprenyl-3-methyl-5-hydroxy-6-metoxy-1,4-benzoquinol methylase
MSSAPSCRACGSKNTRARGSQRRPSSPLPFIYHACDDCHFLFVEPVTPDSVYDDAYYNGRGVDPMVNYRAEYENYRGTDRLSEFEDLLSLATRHLSRCAAPGGGSDVHWLDFGCGAGGLLKFLRDSAAVETPWGRRPLKVMGSDVGSYSQRLRTEAGFDVRSPEELALLPDGSFDIISAIEVIEHIAEPGPVMRLLARLLKPGGLLLLTTGNLASPMARWRGLKFGYCMPEIHISLFCPSTLCRLYGDAGLIPEWVRYRGVITFKVLKSAGSPRRRWLLRHALRLPGFRSFVDLLYGTSAMPCARRP